jgi:hypothetical protein
MNGGKIRNIPQFNGLVWKFGKLQPQPSLLPTLLYGSRMITSGAPGPLSLARPSAKSTMVYRAQRGAGKSATSDFKMFCSRRFRDDDARKLRRDIDDCIYIWVVCAIRSADTGIAALAFENGRGRRSLDTPAQTNTSFAPTKGVTLSLRLMPHDKPAAGHRTAKRRTLRIIPPRCACARRPSARSAPERVGGDCARGGHSCSI